MLFREMGETFGTPQAKRAWHEMNPGKVLFVFVSILIK